MTDIALKLMYLGEGNYKVQKHVLEITPGSAGAANFVVRLYKITASNTARHSYTAVYDRAGAVNSIIDISRGTPRFLRGSHEMSVKRKLFEDFINEAYNQ